KTGQTTGSAVPGLREVKQPGTARTVSVSGRERAERQVVAALLIEPGRWHDVQLALGVEDIGNPQLRGLAEVLWAHQRDEGEPVFSEFVELLPSAELKALALE